MIALKKNETVSFIVTIVAAVLIALFVRTFIFNIAVVNGESMHPTLNEKDKLFQYLFCFFLTILDVNCYICREIKQKCIYL